MRGEKDKVKNGTWSLETFILSPGSAGKHKHHYNRIKPQQFTIIGSKTQLELLPSVSTNRRGNKHENLEMELKQKEALEKCVCWLRLLINCWSGGD